MASGSKFGLAKSPVQYALWLLLSLPVITGLAYLSFRFFENPINMWAKRCCAGIKLRNTDRAVEVAPSAVA